MEYHLAGQLVDWMVVQMVDSMVVYWVVQLAVWKAVQTERRLADW